MDFFAATGRDTVEDLLVSLEAKLKTSAAEEPQDESPPTAVEKVQGRVWVTRKGVHVDRMASAWLIRRFIDPGGRFKFVSAKGYRPEQEELRFDMFDAEFTHEGDLCTFEVLVERQNIGDNALRRIGEV